MSELSEFFAELRDEAVAARKNCGIEKQWKEDEEFYVGMDDLNRGDFQDQYYKPSDLTGVTQSRPAGRISKNACVHFLNLTAPFVDAAASRCADICLPSNDWNFAIRPTPVPEFVGLENDERPMILGPDGQPQATLGDVLRKRNAEAAKKVSKAENHIRDWLTQSEWRRELRKVIEGSAKVGTGIMKGPYPKRTVKQAYVNDELITEETFEPSTCWVDHWNIFPDMNCGENPNDGDYLFERGYMYARSLLELKGLGYDDEAIDKVIKEGPGKRNLTNDSQKVDAKEDDRYEIWYGYKYITSKDLRALDKKYDAACECGEIKEDVKPFLATVMLVNDSIIYAKKWPITDNGFPFDFFVWQRVPNRPFGIGIARKGRTPQLTVLAAYRTLMNNQGLAAKPMMAFMREVLEPVDKTWEIYGGKSFTIKPNKGITDIKQAISTIIIPSMQADLSALIAFGTKSMEDSTGITFLMQGQQGSAPDTVGGQQLMMQNSSTVLRGVIRGLDDCVEAQIKRYYIWLLLYGPDDEKGDYTVQATGSSALLEREIQVMQFPQLMQMALNPIFEMSPKKTADELVRAWKFDPTRFELDDDEKQKMQQMQQPPDPRIQVAQINAQVKEKIAAQDAQVKQIEIKTDMDRDAVFAQGVTERTQSSHELGLRELELKRELAILDYANKRDITLDKAKVDLTKAVMDNNLTKELAHIKAPASQLPTPPVEPPGTAEPGRSFTQ